jgi:kynurenine formamidase
MTDSTHATVDLPEVTEELILGICERVRTWRRWGLDDELGTLNEADASARIHAAGLVRDGTVFSLALPYSSDGPQRGEYGRINPVHVMTQDGGDISSGAQAHLNMEFTDDAVYMPLQCGTQWDALAHFFYEGRMYNGWGTEHVTSLGAAKNSIAKAAGQFVGRGVLVDLPRARGKEYLQPGERVGEGELRACLDQQGVQLRPGDFLLVRTGHMQAAKQRGFWGDYVGGPSPGLSVHSAEYLCGQRPAAVAIDTFTTEVVPVEYPPIRGCMHVILLVNAGIHLGEMFDLDELAEACAADGRYEFLFVAPALPIVGAVGSPVNPIAIR